MNDVQALLREGNFAEAERVCRKIVDNDPHSINAYRILGFCGFRQARYADAVKAFEHCVALAPGNAELMFDLAGAREMNGDLTGAVDLYLELLRMRPNDMRIALFAGYALEAAGRHDDAVTVWSIGDTADMAIRRLKDNPAIDEGIRKRSAAADRALARYFTQFHEQAVDAYERQFGSGPLPRVRRSVWPQTHDGRFEFLTPMQAPTIFYMPDLPARPVTPNDMLPWVEALETACDDIRGEYRAAVENQLPMTPYVDADTQGQSWRTLRGTLDWASIHLYKEARVTENAQHFPKTIRALENADIMRINGVPIEAFFSRLKPGAHIPPHHGLTNARLTVHLPLIVPGDCTIRVGDTVHQWREGKIIAFDDSYEHEVWNRSDADRVVLIFEIHHPDLSEHEKNAIEHASSARHNWLLSRQIP